MQITRDHLVEIHEQITENALQTMQKKNMDYAHDSDVFRNFRFFGLLGVLVRMSDKLARLRTFEERGTFSVADESVRDTIEDLINYAVIFYAMTQENK